MKMKSFFAHDVQTALAQAQRELGPEAMLVDSRPAPPEARHLGQCEVVVAVEAADEPAPAVVEPPPSQITAGIAELQRKLERVAATIARTSVLNAGEAELSGEVAEVFRNLLENDVDPQLAHDVLAELRTGSSTPGQARRLLRAELARRIKVDANLGRNERRPRTVALVGPCAAGKTTTLVKLAVQYGLAARKPTQILSMDCYRIAAADQLRAYAAILGVGFQALETPLALEQALQENHQKDLILIDTPGFGRREMDAAQDLARFFATRDDIDTHLVLTASMKSADLSRVVDQFEVFRPRKLVFTRLDETETFGPILNEAARTAKPISFLTAGQQIPEDLEAATVDRVLDLVLRREEILAAAAA